MYRRSNTPELVTYYTPQDPHLESLSKKAHEAFKNQRWISAIDSYQSALNYIRADKSASINVNDIIYIKNKYSLTLRTTLKAKSTDQKKILTQLDEISVLIQATENENLDYPCVMSAATNLCMFGLTTKDGVLLGKGLAIYQKMTITRSLEIHDQINQHLYDYFLHFSQQQFKLADNAVQSALTLCNENHLTAEKRIHTRHLISLHLWKSLNKLENNEYSLLEWQSEFKGILDSFWTLFDDEKKALEDGELTPKRFVDTLSLLYILKVLEYMQTSHETPFKGAFLYINKQLKDLKCDKKVKNDIISLWKSKKLNTEKSVMPLCHSLLGNEPPAIHFDVLKQIFMPSQASMCAP